MSLAVVVDMNLTPLWVPFLAGRGHAAVHWSAVGHAAAEDVEIMDWARTNGHLILTNDLDYGELLALTHAPHPSVVQLRSESLLPRVIGAAVADILRRCEAELRAGALVTVELPAWRVRVLPI